MAVPTHPATDGFAHTSEIPAHPESAQSRCSPTETAHNRKPPLFRALRVCYFGTYRAGYSRNRIMMDGLRANGVTVIECHESLWVSIEDRVESVRGGWIKPRFWWRVLRTYSRLITKFGQVDNQFDLLVVGYPGQFDLFLARLLSWWRGKPLVWDIFMSIYLIALERELEQQSPLVIQFLRRIEWLGCRIPNQLVLDTADYAAWFEKTHGVPADRFCLVPTGADDTVFTPADVVLNPSTGRCSIDEPEDSGPPAGMASARAADEFVVLYYGSYIPNHGVLTIVEAARHLQLESDLFAQPTPVVKFVFVGDGPQRASAEKQAKEDGLENITFIDWLTQAKLGEQIRAADLCLGSFGSTPQSLMTVQNKVYECMAMARPVLTGDSPAVRKALSHGTHVYLCPRRDAAALADAIALLAQDPMLRERIAQEGYRRFVESFSVEAIGQRYRECLEKAYSQWYGAEILGE